MLADNLFSQLLFVWKSLYYLQLWKIFIVNIKLQLFRTFQPVLQNHSIIFWFAGFLMKNVSSFFFFCIWCVFCIWLTSRFSFHLVSYLNITCLSVFMFRESMCVCVCTHLSLILSFTFHFLGFIDFFHYFLKFLGNYQFKYFFSLLFLELQFYIVKLTIWWSVLPPSFFFLFIFQ